MFLQVFHYHLRNSVDEASADWVGTGLGMGYAGVLVT